LLQISNINVNTGPDLLHFRQFSVAESRLKASL
jgi:hypothetical protein